MLDFNINEPYLDQDSFDDITVDDHRVVHSVTAMLPFCDIARADGRIGFDALVTRVYHGRHRVLIAPCDMSVPTLEVNSSDHLNWLDHARSAPSLYYMLCNDRATFVVDTFTADTITGDRRLRYTSISRKDGDACMDWIETSIDHVEANRVNAGRRLNFFYSHP